MPGLFGFTEALQAGLAEFAQRSTAPTRSELNRVRLEVWLVIDELKAIGEPPERAIRFVKQTAAEAGFGRNRDGIVACIVPWCIERYYDGDTTVAKLPPMTDPSVD